MAVSVKGLRHEYPILSTEHYKDARLRHWIAKAEIFIKKAKWHSLYETGIYAYAAHKLIMEKAVLNDNEDGLGGMHTSSGAVVGESEKVDDVTYSMSYAAPSTSGGGSSGNSDEDWRLTEPGREYLRLSRMVGISRGITYIE